MAIKLARYAHARSYVDCILTIIYMHRSIAAQTVSLPEAVAAASVAPAVGYAAEPATPLDSGFFPLAIHLRHDRVSVATEYCHTRDST